VETSVAMAQAMFFATLGNKLCKITKIFEELDHIKSQGVLSHFKATYISQEQLLGSLRVGRGPLSF